MNEKSVKQNNGSNILNLFTGILIGYAITCIVFIIYAVLITYTELSESSLQLVVTVTSLFAVIVAGFDAVKSATKAGWLWGLIAGFIYYIILITIGIWINKGVYLDMRTASLGILSIAGGTLGGILGINIHKK